ncbi:bifunctional UDP-N-acetylglucosamine diphosphorylase/glucosamine-1-phosphate N-acetyltransferase GlmU [Jatrophihabitans sp.]|uniref:bifunctional UDP-N-acetylglucosamine diphosphorylase/glucosamine-1-phosphate N-acetyltransferase GlmU n=1 Tax=Jatrophihabitans sp. TaxID=1932789 RepID=UPI0030C68C01|nr:glmU [Jatrophihabitans sp.]
MSNALAVVILAAGEGTRMRSAALPKVLHGFAGRSLLGHALAACDGLDAEQTIVVVGHRREEVTAHLADLDPAAVAVVQAAQNGTGHAVRLALAAIPDTAAGTVVVLPGDAPLLRAETLAALVAAHRAAGAAATMLTSALEDPTGYGRVLRAADGSVTGVVEQKDASPEELTVREVASGVYAFEHAALRAALGRIGTDNAQGEEYLPDVIGVLVGDGLPVAATSAPATETAGVNDRVQLAAAHRVYNDRLLDAHMRAGVGVVDPATTWVDATVTLEPDVTLLPGTDLHGQTHIAAGALIGPQVSLTDTIVGAGAHLDRTVARQTRIGAHVTVGPFAYLRPGTDLADDVHIGTYVEVKNSDIGAGTKVPHLSYVGDATIGEQTNIGAATVFVNYDGVAKHRSVIGDHARTGADNMFVAPVHVGDGAYTAAGAVITSDVPPGSLARSSARQENVAGWVAQRRPETPAAHAADRAARNDHPEDEA